ncbi:MAG: FAD-binding protein [Actinomycetota bacterium]|nr:FAD-binding protein [Actinomycetota bacterium]
MAGLCAAARLRELGHEPVIYEKGDRPGGSMLLSSCVIWRHRDFADFRRECPGGDDALQRTVWERLDEALDWLEGLGVPVVARGTDNPRTSGRRFAPRGLTEALVSAAGEIRLGEPFRAERPLVLATGGFAARLARERGLLLRANRWSEGDGLDYALAAGATPTAGMDEFYGRAMPAGARIGEDDFVRLTQLYGRHAVVLDDERRPFFAGEISWSENDLVQAIARLPRRRAWYVVDERQLAVRVRDRTVAEMVAAARAAGGTVVEEDGRVAVLVTPGVTHTIGGIRIDPQARVVGVPALYAAGADVGGIATGGYASGLAAALVFGRIAAETLSLEIDARA